VALDLLPDGGMARGRQGGAPTKRKKWFHRRTKKERGKTFAEPRLGGEKLLTETARTGKVAQNLQKKKKKGGLVGGGGLFGWGGFWLV